MPESVTFSCPLPPVSLRANSRAHFRTKKKDADTYSVDVMWAWQTRSRRTGPTAAPAWLVADVHYEWRYAGAEPDHGNLGGNTKYLQDVLAKAPKMGFERAQKYKRTHLGIVEDDKGIRATYEAVKVAKKADECVIVTLTKRER